MLGLSKQPGKVAAPRSCMTTVLKEGNSPLHAVLGGWRWEAHKTGHHIAARAQKSAIPVHATVVVMDRDSLPPLWMTQTKQLTPFE